MEKMKGKTILLESSVIKKKGGQAGKEIILSINFIFASHSNLK